MPRLNLTEGQIEQIRSMRKDGKLQSEIQDFFLENYKIKLCSSAITYHCKKKHSGLPMPHAKRRRKAVVSSPAAEETGDEFVNHIRAAFAAHKKKFLKDVAAVIEKE
jgi:hypothetical protein